MLLEPRAPEAFRENPYGGYLAGRSWMYFALAPELFGYALWDAPDAEDLSALTDLWRAEGDRPPHDLLADLSRVTHVDARAFEVLASYIVQEAEVLARIVRRAALVRPPSLAGAVASGFFATVPASFPVSLWDDAGAALAHLGVVDAVEMAALATRTVAAVRAVPEPLRGLERYLMEHLLAPSLEGAAEVLGISVRTLQRRLREGETSFSAEVLRVRLDCARRLLVESSRSITDIALSVGFATSQHFSTCFREREGMTPRAYRERQRR